MKKIGGLCYCQFPGYNECMHTKSFHSSPSPPTLRTIASQAPLSMGFSREENWSGLPCPPPGDLPTQHSKPHVLRLLHWQADSLPLSQEGSSHILLHFNISDTEIHVTVDGVLWLNLKHS